MFGKSNSFDNYKPTDLGANEEAAQAAEAESAAKATALEADNSREAMDLSPKNEVLLRQAESGAKMNSVEKAVEKPLDKNDINAQRNEILIRQADGKEKATGLISKAVEKGGKLFSFLQSKWNDGIQAVEKGAWKLGQKMVSIDDAINAGIDKSVNAVADAGKKVAELSVNWARETAEDCRKDIEAGVQNTAELFLDTYNASKWAAERAIAAYKYKIYMERVQALRAVAKLGTGFSEIATRIAQKAEKQISIASSLRDVELGKNTPAAAPAAEVAPEAPVNQNLTREQMEAQNLMTMFTNQRRARTGLEPLEMPFPPTTQENTPTLEREPSAAPEMQDAGMEAAFSGTTAEVAPETGAIPEMRDEGIEAAFNRAPAEPEPVTSAIPEMQDEGIEAAFNRAPAQEEPVELDQAA